MEGIQSSCVLSFYYSRLRHRPPEIPFPSLPPPPSKRRQRASLKARTSLPSMALQVRDQQSKEMLPKIDKSGRFCSPRAARELALLIVYAACLQGSDPIRLFEKRINAARGKIS
ncbi:hypothetical protein V6N13_069017 [Hibiscus sabdariffa]|uniref:Uncharacterized protein n=1 Tax=Hibiscus sabdariffa TaxID=183260 RepID=A0ABR2QPN8_9ROSI